MKSRALLLPLLVLATACGGPSASAATPDAGRALDELLRYRGNGAPAARRVIEWVDEIVTGGPAMLDRLSEVLETAPDRMYQVGTWQADNGRGIFSCLPTLRAALAEAVSRIGGDDAVGLLIREADRPGTGKDAWVDRYAAFAFLKPHAEREDVREYYAKRVSGLLRAKLGDGEARMLLQVARHALPETSWDGLASAFRAGWADRAMADEIATTLASLDEKQAGRLFLDVVRDGSVPTGARAAAARALGRLPEDRPEAVTRILALGEAEWSLVGWFVEGMRHGRFEEDERERAARESLDLDTMLAYVRERRADLETMLGHLATLEAAIGPEVAQKLRFPGWRQEFENVRKFAEEREGQLEAEKGKRGKR